MTTVHYNIIEAAARFRRASDQDAGEALDQLLALAKLAPANGVPSPDRPDLAPRAALKVQGCTHNGHDRPLSERSLTAVTDGFRPRSSPCQRAAWQCPIDVQGILKLERPHALSVTVHFVDRRAAGMFLCDVEAAAKAAFAAERTGPGGDPSLRLLSDQTS